MSTAHYSKVCKLCGVVIAECLCADCSAGLIARSVAYDVCGRCAARAVNQAAQQIRPDDLKAQVYDLSMRRTAVLQTDPALRLAEKLVAVITANTDTADAVDHLIALELAGRATMETIKHARGETWLNACIVDASRRIQAYEIRWPDQDQSKTIYDEKKEEPAKEVGNVLAFPPKPEKT